jgi:glyoxylase-like metal-dependent hydrolase (beta-lactamase superfamily II)
MKIGRYSIQMVLFGSFRLDGGCMFGSVPKNLWTKSIQGDAENCIPLACRSLLLDDGTRKILIDVGPGNTWSDKLKKIYGISLTPKEKLGFQPSEITDVILTHLHFDHAAGVSYQHADGTMALTYPQARIHLQTANWERAQNPSPKDKASYLPTTVEPLKQAQLELCDGTVEILPEIVVHRVDGHTPGQQWIEIGSGDERIFFPTDLIPTSHHVPLAYHMGYDVCADTLLREKLAFLERAVQPGVTVCFQHDIDVPFAKVRQNERGGFECYAVPPF